MKKKTISIILALVLCISLTVPTFAAGTGRTVTDPGGNMTVTNVIRETTNEYRDCPVYWVPDTGTVITFLDVAADDTIGFHGWVIEEGELVDWGTGYGGAVSDISELRGEDGTYWISIWLSDEEKQFPGFYDEDHLWMVSFHDSEILIGFLKSDETPATPAAGQPSTPDAPPASDTPSAWAAEQVNSAIAANIVPENLQLKYTQAVTRAEFAALAVAVYETVTGGEISERTTFSDTTDVNVEKAAAIGVVTGIGENMFDPDTSLTREQAAVMLARLAGAVDRPLTDWDENTSVPLPYSDWRSISGWAFRDVAQVRTAGIMQGVGNDLFAPQDPYTREQSILTIMRLYDFVTGT